MSQILNKTFEWVSFFSQLSIEISVSYQLLTWSSIFLMGISFSLVFFLKIPKEDKKNKNWNRTLELQVNSHERKNMLQIYILTGRDFILVRKSIIAIAVVMRQCGNCNQNLQKKQHLTRHMLHYVKNVVFTCDSSQKTFRQCTDLWGNR